MPTSSREKRSLSERFWSKVDQRGPSECWPWTASALSSGYGAIMDERQVVIGAHRAAFFLFYGYWPSGDVRHACHNRLCVNPKHLLEGDRQQNMQDMVDAGRSLAGERQPNHKLTWEAVRSARTDHTAGESARGLARKYGVSERTMRQCLAWETWKKQPHNLVKMEGGLT